MDSSIDSSAPNWTAYIGNLRSDRSVEQLQREIQSLFESVGVVVLLEDIKVHRKSAKKPAYGFVNLKDKETFDKCIEKLSGLASVDGKELIYPGKVLEVNIARRNKPIKVDNNVPQAKHKKGKKHSKKQKHKITSISNMIQTVPMATDGITIANYPVTIATSVSNNSARLSNENHQHIYFERPDQRYYYIGQKLGTEDRLTEYKQGGGNYLDTRFKIHVEQYVCAFLNSEGGTLLVGVKDDCTVCGVEVSSQREDQLRLDIDKIMKGFNPHVFTNSYKVSFVPVYPSPFITQGNQADQTVGTQNSSSGGYQGLSLSPSFSSKELNPSSLIASETGTESQHADCNLSLTLNEKSHLQTQKLKDTSQSLKDRDFTITKLTKHECLMKVILKVIEVEVHPPYCPTTEPPSLYENNRGEVYVRRDGSIQGPLKASQILEWSKQNVGQSYHLERSLLLQENQRKQNEIEQLVKQQKYIEDQHQEKMEKVKEKEDNLAAEIELLRNQELKTRGELEDIKRTRSKVCIII